MSATDDLAQEIRRVDGDHRLGAGALAEALQPWLAEHDAQVRAEVIRGAAQALRMGLRGSACNEGCHKADRITLEMWADHIEKEAGLK